MIDGKKVIKLLKSLKSVAGKLQPKTDGLVIRKEGIYLIDEMATTAIIKSPTFGILFPHPLECDLVSFGLFMKNRKMKDYIGYEESEYGAIITFKSELWDIDKSIDQFALTPPNDLKITTLDKINWKKKIAIDTLIDRLPEFEKLEEENDELKEILNNSHFPYLYRGFLVMKSICPILTAKAKLYSYDLRSETGIVDEGLSSMAFRIHVDGMDIYSLYAGLVIRELKFSSKKRW